MSTNIITVDTGVTGPGANTILQTYQSLSKNPPAGYSVLQHKNIDELCAQLAQAGQMLGVAEIISHGNPFYLGQILLPVVPQFAQALHMASPVAEVFLSGCNTGTWTANTNEFCIAKYIASKVPCKVYGSMGYIINCGTYAQGNVQCAPTDNPGDVAYLGAITATGSRVFNQKPNTTMPKYAVPFPPSKPIPINSTALNQQQKSVLNNVIGSVDWMPSQKLSINPQTAPDFCIQTSAAIFDFFSAGATVRRESDGATWMPTIDANSQSILNTIATPQPAATAVVQEPAAAPKVRA